MRYNQDPTHSVSNEIRDGFAGEFREGGVGKKVGKNFILLR